MRAPSQRNPLFKRPNHPRSISVESVKLSILRSDDGIAGTDLRRVGISIVEVLKDGLFMRHGYCQALDRYLFDAGKQILQRLGVERKKNSIHIFAA